MPLVYPFSLYNFFEIFFFQASWYGSLISFVQNSPESPLIFSLLHRILLKDSPDRLKELATKAGLTDDEFTVTKQIMTMALILSLKFYF